MPKTGIELPKLPTTGIDTEQVKAHLKFHSEANKVSAAVKAKWLEQLFSSNFLVFIITLIVIISGFVFMSRDNADIKNIIEYWQLILPLVTTYMGYAIGKGKAASRS
jgi:hypothetical protein